MKGELKRKTVRTVHDDKVVRLRIDLRYDELQDIERDGQDVMEWLDKSVDELIRFDLQPFEDDGQDILGAIDNAGKAAERHLEETE